MNYGHAHEQWTYELQDMHMSIWITGHAYEQWTDELLNMHHAYEW